MLIREINVHENLYCNAILMNVPDYISGVPFFIFNQRIAVSGAQPTEIMLKALDAASGVIDIQS